jgi:branched-chain amino acid transport system ATP-binding protein
MSEAVLSIEGLTTGYLRAPVLRDVSLDVREAIVAVLGANGAGKSTLLRAISGHVKPWSGRIRYEGRDIARVSPWGRVRAGISHVPEGRHVFGAMTVRENLDVAGLATNARTAVRDMVFELFPRLDERRTQPAGSLSGGEQQMLVIGRALMTRPRLLIIDEMSAGLAPVTAQLLVESLAAIHATTGLAMLLVEQSPALVAPIVDRAYVLHGGMIRSAGTLEQIGGIEALTELYVGSNVG